MCCSVLQCVIICCSVLRYAKIHMYSFQKRGVDMPKGHKGTYIKKDLHLRPERCQTCQKSTRSNTLQRTASHCNTLQRTAKHCNTLQQAASPLKNAARQGGTRTATNCNTLQHTTTHCNILQQAATHRNTLQHTITRCNTL